MILHAVGRGFEALQQSIPCSAFTAKFDLERRTGVRVNLLRQHDQCRFGVLYGVTQPEPCR